MTTRRRLPIFPLPGVVFFPETSLPLHIFEPRYREMLADALASDRTIGIQLLKGRGHDEAGRPAVYEVGCAGTVVEHEPLTDGRSNIVLRGAFRYRVDSELPPERPYRIAEVLALPIEPLLEEDPSGPGRLEYRQLLVERLSRLAQAVGKPEAGELSDQLGDEGLVNEVLSRLSIDSEEGYRLLSMDRLRDRYAWAVDRIASIERRVELLAPFRRDTDVARWN